MAADAPRDTDVPPKRVPIQVRGGDALQRPLKRSEDVARQIVRDIINRQLRPGDRLPAEAQMLELYGVSRESLREGLRLLEVQGLISIRRGPGGGPTVGSVDPGALGRTATMYYHLAGATYEDLLEAWVVSEVALVQRAARNPDAELRQRTMAPYLDDSALLSADAALPDVLVNHAGFHGAVASLCQNKVLEVSLQTIGHIVTFHLLNYADPAKDRERVEAEHRKLARLVADGNAEEAAEVMHEHIVGLAESTWAQVGVRADDLIDWR